MALTGDVDSSAAIMARICFAGAVFCGGCHLVMQHGWRVGR